MLGLRRLLPQAPFRVSKLEADWSVASGASNTSPWPGGWCHTTVCPQSQCPRSKRCQGPPAPCCWLQNTGDAQCLQSNPCSSTACAPGQEPGTHCMWCHFGYGTSSMASWQHRSGADIKGCTSLPWLYMAAPGQHPSPRSLDRTICPHCCRSLRSALTQLLLTKGWGLCHLQELSLGSLCSGSLGDLEKTMEAINYLPKIMQVVRRGRDPSPLQTLTTAEQGLAMLFCIVTPRTLAFGLLHPPYPLPSTLCWDELYQSKTQKGQRWFWLPRGNLFGHATLVCLKVLH